MFTNLWKNSVYLFAKSEFVIGQIPPAFVILFLRTCLCFFNRSSICVDEYEYRTLQEWHRWGRICPSATWCTTNLTQTVLASRPTNKNRNLNIVTSCGTRVGWGWGRKWGAFCGLQSLGRGVVWGWKVVVYGRLMAELEKRTEQTINGTGTLFLKILLGTGCRRTHADFSLKRDVTARRLHLHTSVWRRGPSVSAVRCNRRLFILWTQMFCSESAGSRRSDKTTFWKQVREETDWEQQLTADWCTACSGCWGGGNWLRATADCCTACSECWGGGNWLRATADCWLLHSVQRVLRGRKLIESNSWLLTADCWQLTAAQRAAGAEGLRFDKQKIPSFMERRAKIYLNCYCGNFELWCWRGGVSWTDRVRDEEVLQRVKGRGASYRQ